MKTPAPLPFSYAVLERYRIRSREQARTGMVGGHQMRRKGQSLEFHEYRRYVPGDDIRHVDWRVSYRKGAMGDLVVRNFVAEERLNLVISVDLRQTMWLPETMSKAMIASWLAESVAVIVLRSDDRILLHRLFGDPQHSIVALRGKNSVRGVRPALERFAAYDGPQKSANLDVLERVLSPTSVWLILSDFYFEMDEQARRLAGAMVRAQEGWRWVLTVDLDSWPHEKAILGRGARKIEGPGFARGERLFEIDGAGILDVETKMRKHKERFQELACHDAMDRLHWEWPAQRETAPANFFKNRFERDKILQRLFMKEA